MDEYTALPVFKKTKERVDALARKDQTYDEFVNYLLDLLEGKKK